ncbi:MAG TPA: Ldh family oxidoreductase [Trueperaceae bacterium]|nr:Ldh family oxidoreductase [Trueperaceae bacterium]
MAAGGPPRRLPWQALEDVTAGLFRKRGLDPADARLVASHLVRADARGLHSHGLLRLGFYLSKLDAGTMSPVTSLSAVGGIPGLPLLSANNGVGQVAAARAMERAMGAAREHGVAALLVRHSNHFGVAQLFTLQAAEAGLIGIVLTNASPAMAPTGGAEKLLGTNPWSVAAPRAGGDPLVVDMANTVVARGKILAARQEGRSIPEGWALDAEGRPTTDPEAALAGMVLPMAGHKGYAVSLAVELLTGILAGGGWLDEVHYPGHAERVGNVTHLFAAIDPEQVGGPGYAERVLDAATRIKAVRRAPGVDEVLLPGEPEARSERQAQRLGVALAPEVIALVEGYADEARILCPWPRVRSGGAGAGR